MWDGPRTNAERQKEATMKIEVNMAELETILGALSDYRSNVCRYGYELGLAGNEQGVAKCDEKELQALDLQRRLQDVRYANLETYK